MGLGTSKQSPSQLNYQLYKNKTARDVLIQIIERKNKEQEQNMRRLIDTCLNQVRLDRALGCLFGSFIGDSLGSKCQFSKKVEKQALNQGILGCIQVQQCQYQAMKMPGGGIFSLKPGQFTDDSQLSTQLLKGLSSLSLSQPLKSQHYHLLTQISKRYVQWLDSKPFDIGNTCKNGLNILKTHLSQLHQKNQEELRQAFNQIFEKIYKINKESQSNGSLMRITPMAVLFAVGGIDVVKNQQFIKDQIRLMHPNGIVQQSSYLWVNMLVKSITRQDDQTSTFSCIFGQCQLLDDLKTIPQWFQTSKSKDKMIANEKIGWAKIAWTFGMNQLYRLSQQDLQQNKTQYYRQVMRDVIGRGGDTDTNAAIVGGFIGSIIGFSSLPAQYLKPMLSLQFPQPNKAISSAQRRPHSYQPYNVLKDAMSFIMKCKQFSCQKQSNQQKKQQKDKNGIEKEKIEDKMNNG